MGEIKIDDMCDLVYVTIMDLLPTGTEIFVSPVGKDKLEAMVNGKTYNFTLAELMEQKHSAKGFINLIKERVK